MEEANVRIVVDQARFDSLLRDFSEEDFGVLMGACEKVVFHPEPDSASLKVMEANMREILLEAKRQKIDMSKIYAASMVAVAGKLLQLQGTVYDILDSLQRTLVNERSTKDYQNAPLFFWMLDPLALFDELQRDDVIPPLAQILMEAQPKKHVRHKKSKKRMRAATESEMSDESWKVTLMYVLAALARDVLMAVDPSRCTAEDVVALAKDLRGYFPKVHPHFESGIALFLFDWMKSETDVDAVRLPFVMEQLKQETFQ